GAPDDEFSWQGSAGTLILATAAEDSNKNIIFTDAKEYISLKNNNIYYLEGTNLYKRTLAAENPDNAARTTCPSFAQSATCPADRLLMGNVEQLTFKYKDASDQEVVPSEARSVEMNIHLKSSRYGREVSVGYSTRMV